MIRPLRKYHYRIWKVLAVLLPSLFISGILLRPERKSEQYFKEDFLISLGTEGQDKMIFIQVQNPIKFPSCFVYAKTQNKEEVIGVLSEKKRYSFSLPPGTEQIVLKDILDKEILIHPLNEINQE